MDHYLDFNSNNNNNGNNGKSNQENTSNHGLNNAPTSTINDQDLLDFSGLDQFLQANNISNAHFSQFDQDNHRAGADNQTQHRSTLTPEIKEEGDNDDDDDDDDNKFNDNESLQHHSSYQPQSYHATPSSYNNKPSSSFTGVRRSLSKAMTNSRKNSIIKDELSSSAVKSPRSRKSSIAGTPGSFGGSSYLGNGGQTTTVERKRRDNINDKIQELLTIIPETFFYENDKSTGTKDGKPNKGQILSKSVEYIQFLQNEIDFKNRKEVEFIYKLKKLNYDTSNFSTSAEIGLGKIGVGPLSHLQREDAKARWLAQQAGSNQQTSQVTQQQQQQQQQQQANIPTPNFDENFKFESNGANNDEVPNSSDFNNGKTDPTQASDSTHEFLSF